MEGQQVPHTCCSTSTSRQPRIALYILPMQCIRHSARSCSVISTSKAFCTFMRPLRFWWIAYAPSLAGLWRKGVALAATLAMHIVTWQMACATPSTVRPGFDTSNYSKIPRLAFRVASIVAWKPLFVGYQYTYTHIYIYTYILYGHPP